MKIIANGNALTKLVAVFPELANQSPQVVASWMRSYDNQFGTTIGKDLFGLDDGASAGGPSAPGTVGGLPSGGMGGGLPSGGMGGPPPSPSGNGSGFGLGSLGASSSPGASSAPLPAGGPPGMPPLMPSGSGASPMGAVAPPLAPPPGGALSGPGGFGTGGPPSVGGPPVAPPSGSLGNFAPSVPPGGYAPPSGYPPPAPPGGGMVNPFNQSPTDRLKGAQATRLGNQNDLNFQNAVGLVPTAQQPAFVQNWNLRNGTSYPVPGQVTGSRPMNYGLPPAQAGAVGSALSSAVGAATGFSGAPGLAMSAAGGSGLLAPQTLTAAPSYQPNALQGATIARSQAGTTLAGAQATAIPQRLQLQQLTQQQQHDLNLRTLQLKAQGVNADTAYKQAMAEVAQQNANTGSLRAANPPGGGGNGAGLQAHFAQRMTQLTAPGKPDMYGAPGAPLVTLDKNGTPSGPGAQEYLQLKGLQTSVGGSAAPSGPGTSPTGYTGPIPNSQADFQRMTPAQKYAYKNVYLRGRNGR